MNCWPPWRSCMSRTVTMVQWRSSLIWWRNVLTRGLWVLFCSGSARLILNTTATFLSLMLCICVIGCIGADPHLIQSSVNTASQGWLDSESPSPHGEVLQVGQSWRFFTTVDTKPMFLKNLCVLHQLFFDLQQLSLFAVIFAERNESRTVIRIKVLHILSFVLSTNRQLYEVCMVTCAVTCQTACHCVF